MPAKRLRSETDDGDYLRGLQFYTNAESGLLEPIDVKQFTSVLEPILRRVVHEEVSRRLFQRPKKTSERDHLGSPPRLQAPVQEAKIDGASPAMMLAFEKPLSLPIFTATKIEDEEGNPLRVILVDPSRGSDSPVNCPNQVRLEVVVLDGDFPGTREDWTSEEFDKSVVKERAGKKPLLISGEQCPALRGGRAAIGDVIITDNSSWIRSRHFRIGVKVPGGSHKGVRIREAISEPFMVKDQRGESYKKHYPPAPTDEVWRLEKIGKDGAYHKRLQAERINTVHDFLGYALHAPNKLRSILGPNMSDRTWELVVAHARTCHFQPHLQPFDRHVLSPLKLPGAQGLPPLYTLYSPTTPLATQLIDCESPNMSGLRSVSPQGATGQVIGFSGVDLPSISFPDTQDAEFTEEMFHGKLELDFDANWNGFLQPDGNSKIFFNGC